MKSKFLSIPMAIFICQLSLSHAAIQSDTFLSNEEVKAKVSDINYKTREFTLQMKDGSKNTYTAGNEIVNFKQIKKGDVVTARYAQALVYEINRGGGAIAPTEKIQAQTAKPGSMPSAMAEREVTASVIISKIDKKTPAVTFKNAAGETSTFKVRHPEKLEGVKVGDRVDITYTESLALKVDKPNKM